MKVYQVWIVSFEVFKKYHGGSTIYTQPTGLILKLTLLILLSQIIWNKEKKTD